MNETQENNVQEWNEDELFALLNSEEIKAFLSQTGDAAANMINDVLASVQKFLKKIG